MEALVASVEAVVGYLHLFALWGRNGFGFGGNYGGLGNESGFGFLSNQLNNDAGRELIMQAIQGNANAINQLSSTLNCNVGEQFDYLRLIQICNLNQEVYLYANHKSINR